MPGLQRAGSRSIGTLGAPAPLPPGPERSGPGRASPRRAARRAPGRRAAAVRRAALADAPVASSAPPAPSRVRRGWALALLLALGAGAVGLLLWPTGGQVREIHIYVWERLWTLLGEPEWFTPEVAEQLANALVLIAPLAALTVLAWRTPWPVLAVLGGSIGIGVELSQFLFLPNRVTDPVDAVWNAVGAWLGVLIGLRLRGGVSAQRRTGQPSAAQPC